MSEPTSQLPGGAEKSPWVFFKAGIIFILGGAFFFGLLWLFENSEQGGPVPWFVALLYNVGGKWAVGGVFWGLGLIWLGLGVRELLRRPLQDGSGA